MAIFRVNKTQDYTIMSNHHLKNKNLSLDAKGLMSVILSLPDNWNYSIAGLVSICKEGKDKVESTLKELKNEGYIKVTKLMPNQTKSGRIEYIYDIFETPQNTHNNEVNNKKQKQQKNNKKSNKPRKTEKKQGGEKQPLVLQDVVSQEVVLQEVENPPQLNTNKVSTNKVNTKECTETSNDNCQTNLQSNIHTPNIPTLEQCQEYANEQGYKLDITRFYNHYESVGWRIKGSPVTNWKALLTNWVKNPYPNFKEKVNVGNTYYDTPTYDF